jgi:glycosyltransferase involved in cell wall biosynthesis
VIFDTHPIQYRSPVFRAIHARQTGLKVYFFDDRFDATRWWFGEVGQIPKQKWELALREGFASEVLHTTGRSPITQARLLRRVLRETRPAAVLVYGYYLPEHWVIRFLCARLGIPLLFVGETFSNGGTGVRRIARAGLLRYFFRGIDRIISIGDKNHAHYRANGFPDDKITRARYCIDTAFFCLPSPEAKQARREWRARLGIPDDAFTLLFVGRMVDRKRPKDVLRLHRELDLPNVHTVMVGNGLLEETLRREAASLPRVHFTGFQNQAQTREAYYGADLLVVPSEFETWGLVVNEAFACGCPAAVTDTCGVAGDLVVNDETGFVFRLGDVSAAAAWLRGVTQDPRRREALGNQARAKVEREYGIGQFASAILSALESASR